MSFQWDGVEDRTFRMFEQTCHVQEQQRGHFLDSWPEPVAHPGGKKTLCLDLDETLVHFTVDEDEINLYDQLHASDEHLIASCPTDGSWGRLYLRPNVWRFLHGCKEKFELVAFTASEPAYANQLIERLEGRTRKSDESRVPVFDRVFTRESCVHTEGGATVKDLRIVGRPLEHVMLLDDQLSNFAAQPDNGILCRPYDYTQAQQVYLRRMDARAARANGASTRRGVGEDDDGLAEVLGLLKEAYAAPDVRDVLRHKLHIQEMLEDFRLTQLDPYKGQEEPETTADGGSASPSISTCSNSPEQEEGPAPAPRTVKSSSRVAPPGPPPRAVAQRGA